MTYQLKADEILEAMQRIDHPRFSAYKDSFEALATTAANDLAEALDIECGGARFEGVDFAGLCVPFWANYAGQDLPESLVGFDSKNEWGLI